MGLGSTAKKLQTLTDTAETLYEQLGDLRDRVVGLEQTTEDTNERIERLETELEQHRAILEAIAEEQDIDLADIKSQSDTASEE